MRVITLCGSLRYQKEMMEIAQRKALEGYCVLTPTYQILKDINITREQLKMLKEAHFKRIEFSDEVLIVNIDNYIGKSTKLEIDYAKRLNKKIIYYTEL